MAIDEALLEKSRLLEDCLLLRFYSWSTPCVSFGYTQRYTDVAAGAGGLPIVRRPTGGGVVHHGDDFTYSVVIPPGSVFFSMNRKAIYIFFHAAIAGALKRLKVSVFLQDGEKRVSGYYKCFENPVPCDIVSPVFGKIAGAAQKHSKKGILTQGSVAIRKINAERDKFEDALLKILAEENHFEFSSFSPPEEIMQTAAKLAATKYSSEKWNEMR
jgi:lipoate-protein ligase A